MKSNFAPQGRSALRILPIACATVLALAFTAALPGAVHADGITVPEVPANLVVPEGQEAYYAGHASGWQAYVCMPSGWTFYGPQATLFDENGDQIATHYLSPNPTGGALRATWQHSRDTSAVWALAIASSTDSAYVAPGAVSWLLLQVVGTQNAPDGGGKLAAATYIHRVNTAGGVAPATGCSAATVGQRAFVPYTTEYIFYRPSRSRSN
jgi:hypothetical protein